jgi:hypothetical protein
MTSREFCHWLQGYFEVNDGSPTARLGPSGISAEQVECIKRHLSLVFVHEIDPSYPNQEKLNALHTGKPVNTPRC